MPGRRAPPRAPSSGRHPRPRWRTIRHRRRTGTRRRAPSPHGGCRCGAAAPAGRMMDDLRAHQVDRRFKLRQLDVLSFAGADAMKQGRQHSNQRMAGIRHVVRIMRAGADRRALRQSGHLDQAGNRRDGRAEADEARMRPGGALHRHGEIDHRRIDRADVFVAEPPALHHAGAEIVGDDGAAAGEAAWQWRALPGAPC